MNLKHIRLVRIDEDAEEVNISLGEAVIGRGELLGCTDKRISRKHCMITLSEDGNIILKAQHQNPVFFTAKDKTSEIISLGNSVVLNDGDEFALLPDSHQFRVTVLPKIEDKCKQNSCDKTDLPSDSVKIKEEVKEPESIQAKEPDTVEEAEPLPVPVKQGLENGMEVENEIEDPDTTMDLSSGFSSRIRILPSWMTDSDTNKPGPSKTPGGRKRNDKAKNDKAVVNKKARMDTKKVKDSADDVSDDDKDIDVSDKRNRNVTRGKLHELSDEEDSDTAETKKTPAKRNRGGRKINDNPKKPVKQKTKDGKNNAADISDGETSDNPQAEGDVGKSEDNKQDMDVDSSDETKAKLHDLSDKEAGTVNADTTKQDDLPTVQNSDDDQSNDASNNTAAQNGTPSNSRQKCLYGAKCYRKNPQHRIDFSHPGDIDYDANDLPECPYGTACYRKNKQHRLDFKHTAAPQQANQPQTKKQRNKQKRNTRNDDYEDDEEDDYDFDDPFLNDASSDDYQPTDSESDTDLSQGDDEDDMKRMIKESRRFTRQRK